MIGHLAYPTGSPCPTLVLDARVLPAHDEALLEVLAQTRRFLAAAGGAHVLKIALVRPSEHPMFDLDYRFVQALPAGPDRFDLRGSCGHSILSAVIAAERMGMVARLVAGGRIRVCVLNSGEGVVCEMDRVGRSDAVCTVYFMPRDAPRLTDLLMTGAPRTDLSVDGRHHEVSLVSSGNPYAFVDARDLGAHTPEELWKADGELFARMSRLRAAATALLGWSPSGVFPKIAAVLPGGPSTVAVRAISVPSWHPTIALTGAVCLATTARIPGTIPHRIARAAGLAEAEPTLTIATPGGTTTASAVTSPPGPGAVQTRLAWSAVGRKVVTHLGSFLAEPLAPRQDEEIARCLSLTATIA
ncbi:PrpF domain-containing protein [Mangrovihabitans endophyticus]|nr:PrpF domain-containing protein [Mangrovihabitans endophyticus]